MKQECVWDERIALRGEIVMPSDVTQDREEQTELEFMLRAGTAVGFPVALVRWPDGVVAMVPGDPKNAVAWRENLVGIYAFARMDQIGAVRASVMQ